MYRLIRKFVSSVDSVSKDFISGFAFALGVVGVMLAFGLFVASGPTLHAVSVANADTISSSDNLVACVTNVATGATYDGYFYDATKNQMVSSYCLSAYDDCTSPTYPTGTIGNAAYWFRSGGQDNTTCANFNVAPTTPTSCVLSASDFEADLYNGQVGSSMTVNNASGTASVTFTNKTACSVPIGISAFKIVDANLGSQQLFDVTSSPAIAPNSTATLTVNTANCATQVDAWYGENSGMIPGSSLYDLNGYPTVPFVFNDEDAGGSKFCGAATTTPATIGINPTSLPNGTTTIPYGATLNATGTATGSFTWTVTSGTLPTGLMLGTSTSATETISGTPTASGTFPFVIAVTNGTVSSTQAYTVMIGANAPVSTGCTLSASDFENAIQTNQIVASDITSGTSTASLTITNKTNCTAPISLSSYKVFVLPYNPGWLSTQQIIAVATTSLVANGTTTMSIPVAACMTQVDAWYGQAPATLIDSNPYQYPNVPFVLTAEFVNPGQVCSLTTPSADLSVTKTVDDANPQSGSTVNYTVAVSALGPSTSTGATATDLLPSGLSFLNATASVGSYATSTGIWTIGDMSASSTATLQVAAEVTASAGTSITNIATATENSSSTDNNPSNNTSSSTITVAATGCTSNCGGGNPTSTIGITPNTLPNGTTTISYSATLNATGTATGPFTWTVASGTLPTGLSLNPAIGGATVTIAGTPSATGTFPFVIKVTNSVVSSTQAYAVTIGAAIQPTVCPGVPDSQCADISVLKTVDNANPNTGNTVNYTIVVNDAGPATSTFVNVQDQLPTGLSFVNATTSQGTYNFGTGNWNIGTVNPNATATLEVAAMVPNAVAGETLTNTATVSQLASLTDPNPANNSSSIAITVPSNSCTSNCGGGGNPTSTPIADLMITKTVDNANPNSGDTVNYTIAVVAQGPVTSTDVAVSDVLPTGLSFENATTSTGTYATSTGIWTIGDMSASSTATLDIAAQVTASAGTSVTNLASITESTSTVDQNPGSSSSTLTVATPACTSNCGGNGGGGGGGGGGSVGVGGGYGGGGGFYTNYNLLINGGAPSTVSPNVTLTLQATGANQMWISNDPSFPTSTNASSGSNSTGWITFSSTYPWVLTSSNGEKTVYAHFSANSSTTIGSAQAAIELISNGNQGLVLGAASQCGIYLDDYIHPVRQNLNDPIEVMKLKVFLNGNLGLNLPITGDYDASTIAAVNAFQVKYSGSVLAPWVPYGLPNATTPTGYVYKTTQRWINLLACPPLNIPLPQLP